MYHSVICIQYFTVIVLQAEILDNATLFFVVHFIYKSNPSSSQWHFLNIDLELIVRLFEPEYAHIDVSYSFLNMLQGSVNEYRIRTLWNHRTI